MIRCSFVTRLTWFFVTRLTWSLPNTPNCLRYRSSVNHVSVKLADIGVEGTNAEVMRASEEAMNRRMRFIYIRQVFSKYGNSGAASSSYHAR